MFRKLLTFEEAKKVILERFSPKPLGVEEISLLEASSRVLAQDVTAGRDIPPFDRSTVDGYAVRAQDTFGAEENRPITLTAHGAVRVGETSKIVVRKKEAAEIVTGAPIPEGADAVVMVEQTERKANRIRVFSAVARRENIMKAGQDIGKGETVLKTGKLLSSREVGVLAALGIANVKVYVVPRVAVFSTGAEVTEPGRSLPAGKIYDINAYTLSAAVLESGAKPIFLGVFPDDLVKLQKALRHALASADVVVTSGGVSVGPKDVMPKAVASLGQPGTIISGIAMKPGKPTTIGLIRNKPVFSLPGHPTSALLVFHLLARPIIQAMGGRKAEEDSEVKALANARMFAAKGRRTFVMVSVNRSELNRTVAEPILAGDSGAITTLTRADGYVEIPENVQFVDVGEEVTVRLFRKMP
ncbi:MAG: gephyrin-like molybdotransferase Glp [Candidatus Bathyarchaeia archaeon]|jgi:putative molybdopterin biosynthesis protein